MAGELSYSDRYFIPKSLTRKQAHSARIAVANKLDFQGRAAQKLRKLSNHLHASFLELCEPVDTVVKTKQGEEIVKVKDYAAQVRVAQALCAVLEQERVVLRIPSPGRDANLEPKRMGSVDPVEVEAQVAALAPIASYPPSNPQYAASVMNEAAQPATDSTPSTPATASSSPDPSQGGS